MATHIPSTSTNVSRVARSGRCGVTSSRNETGTVISFVTLIPRKDWSTMTACGALPDHSMVLRAIPIFAGE